MVKKPSTPAKRRRNGRSLAQQSATLIAQSAWPNRISSEIDSAPSHLPDTNSKRLSELRASHDRVASKNQILLAQKHNVARVAKRAQRSLSKALATQKEQLKNMKTLASQLKEEHTWRKSDRAVNTKALDRQKLSNKHWKRRAKAAEHACQHMRATKQSTYWSKSKSKMKSAGAYSTQIRSLCRKLVMAGVSGVKVPKVIQMCAHTFGIEAGNIPSPRSIGRFVLEGGVGAGIQATNILAEAQGITTSMDSTSQRNINFSSMHIMANTGDVHQQISLGVESTVDHTSETQVAVLKDSIKTICDTTERAPKSKASPESIPGPADIARKLYGANGDHANDQIKVAQLEKEWKIDSWTDHLGNKALLNMSNHDAGNFYTTIQTSAESTAGGFEAFACLDTDTQDNLRAVEYQKEMRRLGTVAFSQRSPSLQSDMTCLVRGGCCLHKDMNATKGGASAMPVFWKEHPHLPAPIMLFNKDNDATVGLASSSAPISLAELRAVAVSEAGAIKLCSLAGAAFNHKDDKKGHQDSHTIYFEALFKQFHRFPDTSNVRYSSFIDAATVLCTMHGAYIEYMEHCRHRKGSGTLNHLESNILKALQCSSTFAELLAVALYGQIISKPYMRLVRVATSEGKGLADLASLHAQVQSHLELVIATPGVVLGVDALAKPATLDGSAWEEPKVLDVLRRSAPKLPFITDLFVAFCQGALRTWRRFVDEYAANSPLSPLSEDQKKQAFMPPTNDANEGALGTWRVWTRRFPRLTLHRFNAVIMNRANKTEAYMEANFTPDQYTWSRAEARAIDSSNKEGRRKAELAAAALQEAEKNQAIHIRRADKRHQKEQYIAGIQLVHDKETIQKMKGSELNDQLKAYRHVLLLSQRDFPATSKLKVTEKKNLVVELAIKYAAHQSSVRKATL